MPCWFVETKDNMVLLCRFLTFALSRKSLYRGVFVCFGLTAKISHRTTSLRRILSIEIFFEPFTCYSFIFIITIVPVVPTPEPRLQQELTGELRWRINYFPNALAVLCFYNWPRCYSVTDRNLLLHGLLLCRFDSASYNFIFPVSFVVRTR